MDSTRELPKSPVSWFYVGPSSTMIDKPRTFSIGGIEFVAFRSTDNSLVALDRRCSHMKADLALGCVKNNVLQCSLHHLKFDRLGNCDFGPSSNILAYPIVERNGSVFFFNDVNAKFPLPFFLGMNPKDFEASTVQIIHTENEWFVGAANAFDLVHFETVHLRRLLKTPIVSSPDPYAFRIELDYEILGSTLSDKLMKTFYGNNAGLDFTVYGGNFILAVTTVNHLKNYMMIVNAPDGDGKSLAHLMVYSLKTKNPLKKLKREIQARFSQKFFQDEANNSKGVFIDNKTLLPNDRIMGEYLNWLMKIYQ